MNILIHSYAYSPSVGGIEKTTELLAKEFKANGHRVEIITHTHGASETGVLRKPGLFGQWKALSKADIVWQNHISLRYLLLAVLSGKPVVVTLQTWLGGQREAQNFLVGLKRLLLRTVERVAISHAIRLHLNMEAYRIGNPVGGNFATKRKNTQRKGVLFVGRLVSDKGLDLMLHAVAEIHPSPVLTVVGDGPESQKMVNLSHELGIRDQVHFTGALTSEAIAEQMQLHSILVVPSRWEEPLGIVALEGLASGCRVLVSDGGGLKELTEYGALVFQRGDVVSLCRRLEEMLADAGSSSICGNKTVVRDFSVQYISAIYLRQFALL